MGKWGTHDVNLGNAFIKSLKEKGYRFCYIHNNEDVFAVYTKNKSKAQNDKSKAQNYVFTTDNGDKINGNIFHLVEGSTYGCREIKWFIVRPGIQSDVADTIVVEDL